LLAAVLVALVSIELELLLQSVMSLQILLVLSFIRFMQWILYGFMALLVLEAIFSWVNPSAPFAPFIRALNAPILSPLRRLIPPMGGIDFSPLVALIILQVLNRILSELAPQLLIW